MTAGKQNHQTFPGQSRESFVCMLFFFVVCYSFFVRSLESVKQVLQSKRIAHVAHFSTNLSLGFE